MQMTELTVVTSYLELKTHQESDIWRLLDSQAMHNISLTTTGQAGLNV